MSTYLVKNILGDSNLHSLESLTHIDIYIDKLLNSADGQVKRPSDRKTFRTTNELKTLTDQRRYFISLYLTIKTNPQYSYIYRGHLDRPNTLIPLNLAILSSMVVVITHSLETVA